MRESLPTEGEMRNSAGSLTQSLPLRFETSGQIAGMLVEQVVYGLSDDYWTTFSTRIEGVSRQRVQDLASRLLDSGRLAILVVGDAEAVLRDLENLGPVTVRKVP